MSIEKYVSDNIITHVVKYSLTDELKQLRNLKEKLINRFDIFRVKQLKYYPRALNYLVGYNRVQQWWKYNTKLKFTNYKWDCPFFSDNCFYCNERIIIGLVSR